MTDIRQTLEYANYLKSNGWIVERINGINYFIKKLPLLGSILKLQRPKEIDFKIIKTSYVSQEAGYADGIDSFRYYNNMAELIIFKKEKLIIKKQIFKEDFKSLLPREFMEKALMSGFSFLRTENNNFVFKVFVGVPDTDNEQGFKYLVSTSGKISV